MAKYELVQTHTRVYEVYKRHWLCGLYDTCIGLFVADTPSEANEKFAQYVSADKHEQFPRVVGVR